MGRERVWSDLKEKIGNGWQSPPLQWRTKMDVICAQCGEPWEYYGIHHGDMESEDVQPFLKGEGCPCCFTDPEKQNGAWIEEHFHSLSEATDDIGELMDSLPPDAF